ncbi:FGFR1 oncogene partner 2 homolog [Rhipicephalus microplus]|uniref:FGFR1 oncogene partner 2 homolog n=1 Tax=Rhipicephalus microplus TaxID=6941 RepID=UPI003F6D7C66
MSNTVSVQEILGEARRLVERLRAQECNVDRLLVQAQALNQGAEAMRKYPQELTQQEIRRMRQLHEENAELVTALKEHQSALHLVMTKYREHVARLGSVRQAEHCLGEPGCHHLPDKICEMVEVMRRAAEIDESSGTRQTETLVRLATENAVLRQQLHIGQRAGSDGLADVEVQTDSGIVASPE